MTANRHRRTAITALALAASTLALYSFRIGVSPIYLKYEETYFALEAHAIALTGHDTHGRFLPVYFQVFANAWYQPVLVYVTAFFLEMLPLSEAVLRLPSAVAGTIDVVLMYLVARQLFRQEAWAVVAAATLALTPVHVIESRVAMDYLFPVPFTLAWLLCLLKFEEHRKPWILFAGASLLGLGFFSYIAAVVMMPIYLVFTILMLLMIGEPVLRRGLVAVAGFMWPVLLSIPFHLKHPEFLRDQLLRYGPQQFKSLDPVQRARELFNYTNFSGRVSLYFEFFNPAYLFLIGGTNPVDSTRMVGVFLLVVAFFLPVGVWLSVSHRPSPAHLLLVLGFATSPLAALLMQEAGAIDRELVLLPFVVLLATLGAEHLWAARLSRSPRRPFLAFGGLSALFVLAYTALRLMRHQAVPALAPAVLIAGAFACVVGLASDRSRNWRPIILCFLLLGLTQFAYFYHDYLTDYRVRTAGHFGGNLAGAIEDLIAREPRENPTPVFISTAIQQGDYYWRLYLIKHGREDLLVHTTYVDLSVPDRTPARGFILAIASERSAPRLQGLRTVKVATEPDGTESFVLLAP